MFYTCFIKSLLDFVKSTAAPEIVYIIDILLFIIIFVFALITSVFAQYPQGYELCTVEKAQKFNDTSI